MKCGLNNYRYSLDAQRENNMEGTVYLNNLKPAKSYIFILRRIGSKIISKEFRTKEGGKSIIDQKK